MAQAPFDTKAARDALVNAFKSQAEWRERVADEWPEDHRNRRSAEALTSLAEALDAGDLLELDDPGLLSLAAARQGRADYAEELVGEDSSNLTGRFGFDREEPFDETRYSAFVREVIDVLLAECAEMDWQEVAKHID